MIDYHAMWHQLEADILSKKSELNDLELTRGFVENKLEKKRKLLELIALAELTKGQLEKLYDAPNPIEMVVENHLQELLHQKQTEEKPKEGLRLAYDAGKDEQRSEEKKENEDD